MLVPAPPTESGALLECAAIILAVRPRAVPRSAVPPPASVPSAGTAATAATADAPLPPGCLPVPPCCCLQPAGDVYEGGPGLAGEHQLGGALLLVHGEGRLGRGAICGWGSVGGEWDGVGQQQSTYTIRRPMTATLCVRPAEASRWLLHRGSGAAPPALTCRPGCPLATGSAPHPICSTPPVHRYAGRRELWGRSAHTMPWRSAVARTDLHTLPIQYLHLRTRTPSFHFFPVRPCSCAPLLTRARGCGLRAADHAGPAVQHLSGACCCPCQ